MRPWWKPLRFAGYPWVAFARTGDPNGDGRPVWPRYAASERRYMRFEDAPKPDRDLLPGMMELHKAIDERRLAAGIPWDGAKAGLLATTRASDLPPAKP